MATDQFDLGRRETVAATPPLDPKSLIQHLPAAEYFFAEGCFIIEWWNTPADAAVSVARARVEPGVTTRWHRLRGVTERYLILEGQGRVELSDRPPEAVGPGAVVSIPPGMRQRIANTGSASLIFLAVCTPRFTPACYEDLGADHPEGEGAV
ncbi:MAG: cupin domain-containing protein [Candidatus Competibacter sp.]|nr:cupin domain-containing protein [Candidatus Competibacter sp.]